MKRKRRHNTQAKNRYRIRILACIIAVEFFMLALVLLWPSAGRVSMYRDFTSTEKPTFLQTPVITRQAASPPPPPSPRVPVEVPDEQIIEDQNLEFLEFNDIGESDSLSITAGNPRGGPGKIYKNPELAPSIRYIVEPTIQNKTDNKVLIYVRFLVDKTGNVEEATIARILLFDEEGNPTIEVKDIAERILSATIKAALDWKFRPAKVNEEPVRSLTMQTFTIDY